MRFALLACLAIIMGCSQEIVDRAPVTGSELALPAANDTAAANVPPTADDTPATKDTPAPNDTNDAKDTKEQLASVASVPELPSYLDALDIAEREAKLVQVAKFDLDGHERLQARLRAQRDDASRPGASNSSTKPATENLTRIDAEIDRVSKEIEAGKETLRRAQSRLDYATDIVNQIIKRDGREKSAE